MSTLAGAAAASASGGQPDGSHAAIDSYPLLAVCWSEEDAARVREVAAEIAADAAASGAPPPLSLHLDPASLPPGAAPALDAAAVSAALRSGGGDDGTSRLGTAGGGASNSAAGGGASKAAGGGGGGGCPGGRCRSMGRVLLAASLLGSTQDVLRTHGSRLGDGAVVVADTQTGGRGRGGNVWTSPPGCLMFSCLRRLRVASPAQAPFINYLVCLAVTRGVARALQVCGLPPVDLRIKWPNDIHAGGLKLAGALINTTWQGGSFNVITGIGLNVNNRTPTTCLDELVERAAAAAAQSAAAPGGQAAAPLSATAAPSVPREAVLAGILSALEEVFDTFESAGFAPLEAEYLASWLHSGQELDFDDSDPIAAGAAAPSGQNPATHGSVTAAGAATRARTRLTIRGLSPSGFLLAEDAGGGRYELTPDGNSLDMMAGLIRRKIM